MLKKKSQKNGNNFLEKSMFHPSVQRRRFFEKSTIQKQVLHVVAMLANRSGRNEQSS
jgi:hypothetical protein